MLWAESRLLYGGFEVHISKCFCYFNSQGGACHELEAFHIRNLETAPVGIMGGIQLKWSLIEGRGICGASRVKN